MARYSDFASSDEAVLIETDDFALVYDKRNKGFYKKRWSSATKSWTSAKAPYSALVAKDGSTVWAEDASGKTIASGEAGVDDASVIQSAVNALQEGDKLVLVGVFKLLDTIDLSAKPGISISGFSDKGDKDSAGTGEIKTMFDCSELGNKPAFKHEPSNWCRAPSFENLVFWRNDASKGGTAIYIYRGTMIYLRNLLFKRFNTAIDLEGVWNGNIENVAFDSCGSNADSVAALRIRDGGSRDLDHSNNIKISGVEGGGTEYAGISLEGRTRRVSISHVRYECGNGRFLLIQDSAQFNTLTNFNILYGSPAIEITAFDCKKNVISGGTIDTVFHGEGIVSRGVDTIISSVNLFKAGSENGDFAIDAENLHIIIDCVIEDGYGGIKIAAQPSIIANCHIRYTKETGIRIYSAKYSRVVNNYLTKIGSSAGATGVWAIDAWKMDYGIIAGNIIYQPSDGPQCFGIKEDGSVNALIEHNRIEGNVANKILIGGYSSGAIVRRNIGYLTENSGTATFSGDGTTTQFSIAHGLVSTPTKVLVTPMTADAASDFYVTADATNIYVNYKSAPPSGSNNIKLSWYAEV
ncbi:hypothetical protein DRO21_06615 [archaeon]|nr:MAG: hypothetical protein DRO21_06615 [archaeon]